MRASVLAYERKPLRHWIFLSADWFAILAVTWLACRMENGFVTLAAIFIIGTRQHALFVMVHEAAHGHLAKNKLLNEWTSDLFCAFPLLFDTSVYRTHHLAHHRHLNTDQDPDWVRKHGRPDWCFPVKRSSLALFVPYFAFVKGPSEWVYITWLFTGLASRPRWRARPRFMAFKLLYFCVAIAAITALGLEKVVALYWLTPIFFVLPILNRIRSVAEHFAVNYADPNHSSRDVRTGLVEGFLFSPHHVNYHLTHHLHPFLPFYALPEAHRKLRVPGGELARAQVNAAYFLPYENSVLRDILKSPAPESAGARKAG